MRALIVAIALFAGTASIAAAQSTTLHSCPLAGSGGDQVTRGFYVTNYPGATLGTVTISYTAGSGPARIPCR
jgi:hypothetical protein